MQLSGPTATNLGFPRIGPHRELKRAVERFWAGKISVEVLQNTAAEIRRSNWLLQRDAGIEHIPSNDFSLYDHVLDMAAVVGAVPRRFGFDGDTVSPELYFEMARGCQHKNGAQGGEDAAAMEMTKWFDTNYHYIVPEFEPKQSFRLSLLKPVIEFREAKALGIHTRPVLIGPVSFLMLGKSRVEQQNTIDLLPRLLPVYEELLKLLRDAGADWLQIDEPFLTLDLTDKVRSAFQTAYKRLNTAQPDLRILFATYFSDLRENLSDAVRLPVAALHLDLVRAPHQLDPVLNRVPPEMALSLGVVDGRNIWKTDFNRALATIQKAVDHLGPERVMIGPSCSLLHTPVDLDLEADLDDELKLWLAFAKQKLKEISILTKAVREGVKAVETELKENRSAFQAREVSARIHDDEVKRRVSEVQDGMMHRRSPFPVRKKLQQEHLNLPLLPTTTIGSFPQTKDIRTTRADFKAGRIDRRQYEDHLREETRQTVRFQEEIGLDVLVHGEAERTDMVEYFGERLKGFAFTANGWVQSYGSRCVRPPVIYGDVRRQAPMTIDWSAFAQSLTSKPMKGMLTGPVTILQWSFVRDDQPREETCRQIALAVRDEVLDLEKAGISVIQIDEPALREGLPLRRSDWELYLKWAVGCFRLASAVAADTTQIHTHMCYAEFNDIISAIADMDADVISIESSRSGMELLGAFRDFQYPNDIGPGVYDIHSPRIPDYKEIKTLLRKALGVLKPDQVWVNPDCGLKTRRWADIQPSLKAMVDAAKALRTELVD